MRYDVTYLTHGDEETTHVEAADAAAAVEAVQAEHEQDEEFFELLSVVPAPDDASSTTGEG